ncbi:protein AF1q [Hippocampus comes]|nr:PREDICTED: protein AF1q [Hippocampus comes]
MLIFNLRSAASAFLFIRSSSSLGKHPYYKEQSTTFAHWSQLCSRLTMMEKSSSQYDSFLFWRQPIPALDLSELRELGLLDGPRNQARDDLIGRDQHEEELSEFSSFNYWRDPIADVDALLADLNLLL